MHFRNWVGLLSCFIILSSQAQDISQVNARKFTLQLLRVYSPEHYVLIERYQDTPSQVQLPGAIFDVGKRIDFMTHIIDTTRKELIINDISAMLRRVSHSYTHRGAYQYLAKNDLTYQVGESYFLYYLNPKESVFLVRKKVFPAYEIRDIIPPEYRFAKYKAFIATNDQALLPQKNGIYGLLDEWNAFYHGGLFAFEMKEFYEREGYENVKNWEHYFANYYEYHVTYWEWKYYILSYLKYTKYKYPSLYKQLREDAALRQAYQKINQYFGALIATFNKYKPLVLDLLKTHGISIEEERIEDFDLLFLDKVGIQTHQQRSVLLQKALQQKDLRTIEKEFSR